MSLFSVWSLVFWDSLSWKSDFFLRFTRKRGICCHIPMSDLLFLIISIRTKCWFHLDLTRGTDFRGVMLWPWWWALKPKELPDETDFLWAMKDLPTSQQRILQRYLNWWQLNSSARSSSSSAVPLWIAFLIIALLIICGRVQTHLLRLGLSWLSPSLSEGEMQSQGWLKMKGVSVWHF